jgi:hypothetical protein
MGVRAKRSLGRQFGWLWSAYSVSALGTGLAFNAVPLIAILVLHTGPAGVSALDAVGLTAGAVVAIPLGPWIEFRRKRPVMIAMDLTRFGALVTVPAAFALGWLGYPQLLVVTVFVEAAEIVFKAAGGAHLKALVQPADLLVANSRFESTTWTTTMLGPALGGAAIGMFGPVTTVVADAVSYLLSALGIRAIGRGEQRPVRAAAPAKFKPGDLLDGWRHILGNRALRPLFFNNVLFGALIMATSPLLTVLMLGRLGFAPWQYGLALAGPCLGGLIGSRLSRRFVARLGQHRVMRVFGTLRAVWPVGLVFIRPGVPGLLIVAGIEFALIFCIGVANPVFATRRLELPAPDRVARTLSTWSITGNLTTAALTALWGLLAALIGPRLAIGAAGLLLLGTPLLLPRREEPVQVVPPAVVGAQGEDAVAA